MPVPDAYLTPAWTNQLYANVESASGLGSASALATGPILNGFNAWTFDPASAANGSSSTTGGLTTGTVYLSKIYVNAQIRVSSVSVYGVAAGSGNAFTGLYDAYGRLLGTSAAAAIPAGGVFAGAQTTAFQAGPGLYYAAVLQLTTGAGTLGGLAAGMTGFGAVGLTVPVAFPYTNLSSRFLINATSQTTLPAQLTATNATATSALGFWAGLS